MQLFSFRFVPLYQRELKTSHNDTDILVAQNGRGGIWRPEKRGGGCIHYRRRVWHSHITRGTWLGLGVQTMYIPGHMAVWQSQARGPCDRRDCRVVAVRTSATLAALSAPASFRHANGRETSPAALCCSWLHVAFGCHWRSRLAVARRTFFWLSQLDFACRHWLAVAADAAAVG